MNTSLPRPIAPSRPAANGSRINEARVIQSVRARFNPIRQLTPERLSKYLDSFDLGFFRELALVWDKMERRDDTLKTVAPKCYKSVARHGYEICQVEEIPAGLEALAGEQARVLKYFYDHVSATDALERDLKGGFALLARQMMRAKGHRYSVHEMVLQPTPAGLTALFVHCPLWWFEGTQGKLRFLPQEFGIYGDDMAAGEWLVTVGEGLMEAACVLYMLKHLPLKSWLAYLDKFGMPGLLGRTDAPPDSEEWNNFEDALKQFAEEWSMISSRGNEIEIIEPKASTGESGFEKIIERCDRGLTRLFRGGDLGTMSSRDAAGASLQQAETEVLEVDDARMIEETLALGVSRVVIEYQFGPEAPALAYLRLNAAEKENVERDLKIDQFLVDREFPVTHGSAAERYHRPLPEGVDAGALLKRAADDSTSPAPRSTP